MFENLPYILLTVFGIGLVIFVHELGHFLAARAVGIRVEVFSIGFGRRIAGFRRGATDYRLCLIPLGGYVKMAGEDPTRPTTGKTDEFGSKTVGQRILVISAGVIMNVIFALIALPIIFSTGLPVVAPIIGHIEPGGPAWQAGLKSGDRIVAIADSPVVQFDDLVVDVSLSSAPLDFDILRGGKPLRVAVAPVRAEGKTFPAIQVASMLEELKLDAAAFEDSDRPERKELAAALKAAGLQVDDVLVRVNGYPSTSSAFYEQQSLVARRLHPVAVTVRRGGDLITASIAAVPNVDPDKPQREVGISSADHRVKSVQKGGRAESAGIVVGDLLASVDGEPVPFLGLFKSIGQGSDPRVTPTDTAGAEPAYERSSVKLGILRAGVPIDLSIDLPTRTDRVDFLDSIAWGDAGTAVTVDPEGAAARAGMKDRDLVLKVDGTAVDAWKDLAERIRESNGLTTRFTVRRGTQELELEVTQFPVMNIALDGFLTRSLRETARFGAKDSLTVGTAYCWRTFKQIILTLRGFITGSVPKENLGGPILIFKVSVAQSKTSVMRGLLFLAVISINLAVINFLPIPVLDGGWFMFLILEKIRGKPVTEKMMQVAQWIGLVLILALMLFATWNDIAREFDWH